jgi:hypothetical protein
MGGIKQLKDKQSPNGQLLSNHKVIETKISPSNHQTINAQTHA